MDFEQKKIINPNENDYHYENLKLAREFSKELLHELKELVRSIVIFGSNTNSTLTKTSDIDLMIVLDNVSVYVSPELRESYHIIVNKLISEISDKFHIMTVNLSDFWDMSRKGDPIMINILRYGLALFDRDLVTPMQYLLEIGRIKPTRESLLNYKARGETLLEENRKHLELALLDLYYAVVDSTHAILMLEKITPPSPKEMPELFEKYFGEDKDLSKYSTVISDFYKLSKDIEHKGNIQIDGKMYDKYYKLANSYVLDISKQIKLKLEKIDNFDL